jgi:arabinose-5-phosphate isomerase
MLDFVSASSIPAILIGSSPESTAARKSDVVISYGAIAEAGPHGIAPTTSTTVMLILGDALALACANQIGMTPVEFARNHPGGSLGKALISIREVMRTGDRFCVVHEDETTLEAVKKYQNTKDRPGAAVVVDLQGRLTGIFTDGNLRRCVVQGAPFLDRPIRENMTPKPIVVSDHQRIGEALDVLTARKIDQVIVVDESDIPVGLIDIQDLVHLL